VITLQWYTILTYSVVSAAELAYRNMECDVLLVNTIILKVGVGMSMEGIEQNPIVYDLMSEMAFHHEQVDLQVK